MNLSVFPLIFLLLIAAPHPAGSATARPAAKPKAAVIKRSGVVEFKGSFRGPKIMHNRTTAQIEGLRTWQEPSGWHNPGLTVSEHVLNTRYQLGIEQDRPDAPYRVYLEKLDVEFGYTRLDVYVASEYPKGSCEYREILKHELEHVGLHRETYRKYKKLLKDSLGRSGKLPTKKKPLSVKEPGEAQAQVDKIVKQLTEPIYDLFQKELVQVQAKIDTPANYHAIQMRCKGWRK